MSAEAPLSTEHVGSYGIEQTLTPAANAIDFLQRIYGEDERVASLVPTVAGRLAGQCITAYRNDYLGRCSQPKWRSVAMDNGAMASLYVQGWSAAAIHEERSYGLSPSLVDSRITDVARWMVDRSYDSPSLPSWLDAATAASAAALEQKQKSKEAFGAWLAAREYHQQVLFGDADTVRSAGQTPSLVTLARQAKLAATRHEQTIRTNIARSVANILEYHDEVARGGEGGNAIFAFVNPDRDLARIADMTAGVIWRWERVWKHSDMADTPSPFAGLPDGEAAIDFNNTAVQRVIETAAAIGQTLHHLYFGPNLSAKRSRMAGVVASRYSPDSVTQWVRGDTVRAHCAQKGFPADEVLDLFEPSRLTCVLLSHPDNPLLRVEQAFQNYRTLLSNEGLMSITGWPRDEVERAFLPYARKVIARAYTKPEDAVHTILKQLETTLSTEQLAAKLQWAPEQTDEIFPKSSRIFAMIGNKDPLALLCQKARRLGQVTDPSSLAQELGWGVAETRQLFPAIYLRQEDTAAFRAKTRRIAYIYETVMTNENLEAKLGASDSELQRFFPEYGRRRIAHCAGDPIARARAVLQTARRLVAMHPEASDSVIATLALKRPKKAEVIMQIVLTEQPNRPIGIPPGIWDMLVVRFPYEHHACRRFEEASAYRRAPKIPLSLDKSAFDSQGFWYNERDADKTPVGADPAEVVIPPDDPAHDARIQKLESLAAAAGIAPAELSALLEQFSDYGSSPNDGLSATLLQKLRQAASGKT